MAGENFVQRHCVPIYFVFVFVFAWIGSYLAVGTRFLGSSTPPELSDIGLLIIPMLGAPFLGGLLMTALVDGRRGLKDFVRRMVRWRIGGRWYLPLLIFPALLLTVLMVLAVTVSSELIPTFVVPFLFIALLSSTLEETGWTGFVWPKMSTRGSVLSAGLTLGIVHGFWHLGADFLANYGPWGQYWLPYFVGFFLHVVALRILIVWTYTNTGSLFLAILMHASSTGFYGFFTWNLSSPEYRAIFFIVYGLVLFIPAVAVILKYGKTLETPRAHVRPTHEVRGNGGVIGTETLGRQPP